MDNAGSAGIVAGFENSAGECTINPTSSSVNCSSDITLKKNIVPIGGERALAGVRALEPVFFQWNAEDASASQHSGFIAQSVQPIFPDLISAGSNGKLLLNYAGFTPYLVKAVQQLYEKLNDIAATVAAFADSFATKELTFTRATGDEIDANTGKFKTLCVGETCVTESELQALLRQTGQSSAAAPTAPAPTSPPTGEQPANVTVTESSAPPVIDSPPLAPAEEPEPETGASTLLDTAGPTEPAPVAQ